MKFVPTGRPTVAYIDLDALAFNFESCRRFFGDAVEIMAVVKADAYGHGSIECARRLEMAGASWFGVAMPEEGFELRKAGILKPILSMGGVWEIQAERVIKERITPVIFSIESARMIDSAAAALGTVAEVHVKVDTGMGRLGVLWDDVPEFADAVGRLSNLSVRGLMSHLAAADNPDENEFTERQMALFERSITIFREKGHRPAIIDIANSPGAVAFERSRGGMVRLGGILYGLSGDILPPTISSPELRAVMSVETAIAHIKRVPKGETLGYGRTFQTKRDSIIASLPIGYHDGYRRALSTCSSVLISGRSAPVVGRISMDWTLVDITDIKDTSIGSHAVIIGQQGEKTIRAEDLARELGTISYEITCGISSRVPRVFLSGSDELY